MPRIDKKAPPLPSSKPAEGKPVAKPLAPQVQAPLAGWQAGGVSKMPAATKPQQHQMEIVCPVLASMVKEGKLPMDAQGNIKLKDLRNASGDLGISKPLQGALTGIGWAANSPLEVLHNIFGGEMNVLELRSGTFKHPSDSAVLNSGKFDPERFNALVAHAENGRMTADSFSAAIADNTRRDMRDGNPAAALAYGKNASLVEFSALLALFGTKDASGKVGIPVEQLRGMYQDKKLPPSTGATLVEVAPLQASMTMKVDANLANEALGSVSTSTGLSRAGSRLSDGERASSAVANASVGAGKAAACPYMGGKKAMPNKANDTINVHTAAGVKDSAG